MLKGSSEIVVSTVIGSNIANIFLVLGVAVFDTCFTILNRIKKGNIKKFGDILTYAGKDHFHHRLHDIGLPDKGAVAIIFLITINRIIHILINCKEQFGKVNFLIIFYKEK